MDPRKFVAPAIISVRLVQNMLSVSQPGAANLLRTLTEHGIVREVGSGPGVRAPMVR